jgi:hypothetical protein
MQTYEWVKSWGTLDTSDSALDLVNMEVDVRAHAAVQRSPQPLFPVASSLLT